MRRFRWLGRGEIPRCCDLRLAGWILAPDDGEAPALARPDAIADCILDIRHILVLAVSDSARRARLLARGFGDALDVGASLEEIGARAAIVHMRAGMLPRWRHVGPLRLDLLARDGFVDDRPLRLHPREFALAWRLAEKPGEAVAKPALIAEVWRLQHVPDTNSLAVHVFRLRAKLAVHGLEAMVVTTADGAYRLAMPGAACDPAVPPSAEREDVRWPVTTQDSSGSASMFPQMASPASR